MAEEEKDYEELETYLKSLGISKLYCVDRSLKKPSKVMQDINKENSSLKGFLKENHFSRQKNDFEEEKSEKVSQRILELLHPNCLF